MAKTAKAKPKANKHFIEVKTLEGGVFIRPQNIAAVRQLYGHASRVVLTVGGATVDCQEDAAAVVAKIKV
jgi:hypothetical protein